MSDKETKEARERLEDVDTSKLVADIAENMQQDEIVTLPNGIRVRFRSVAPDLLRKVQSDPEMADPSVPMVPHPNDEERLTENPYDPEYKKACRVAAEKRTDAVMQAMVLLGVELVDGIPGDDEWLDDFVFLGVIDKSDAANAGKKLKEIWYKRFVALDATGFDLLQKRMGLNEEMVANSRKIFQRNA